MDAITDRCVVLKNLPCDTQEEEVRGCLNDDWALRGKFKDVEKYEVLEDDVRWIVLFKNVNDAREIRAKKSWKWTLCGIECTVIADLCSECVIPQHWNLDMVSMESDESDWEKVKFPSHSFSDLSTHEPRSDIANHGSEGLPSNPSGLPCFKQLDPYSLTSSSSWEPFTPFTSDRSERMDSDLLPALSGFDDSLPPAKDKPSTSFNSGTASITSDQLFGGDSTVSNDSRSDDQKMYGSARGGSTVNDVKLANLELNDVKDVRSDSQNSDSSGAAQFSPPSSSSDSFEIIKEPCSADKLFESSLILNDNMLVEDQGVKCSDKERTVGSRMMNKDAVTGTTMDLTKNSEEQSEVVKSHRKSPIREVHVTTLNNKNTGTNDMSDLRVVSSDSVRSDDLYGSGSGKQYSSGGFETFSNISSSEARQSTDTYEDDKANTHQARKDSDLKNPAIKEPATNLNPMSPTLSPFPNQASNTQQPHGPQFTMYGHGYATARFPKSMMADSNARSPSPVSPSFMPAMYPYPIAWPQQPGFPQAMGFPTQQAGFAAPQSGFPQQPGLPQQPGFPQHHQPFQSIPYMMPYGQRFDIQHAGSAVGNKTPDENRPENFENQKPAVSSGGTGEDKKDRPNTFGGIQAPKKKEIPKPPPVDKPIDHSMSEIKRMGLGNRSHLESKYYSKEPVYDEIPVDIDLGSLPPVIPPAMPDPKLKVSTDENSLIIVKGIPATTLVEEIELFFEHRRKSGGGAIKNIDFKPDKGQAVIEYKLSADATSVLEKATITDLKLPISGCKLTVGPYQPPPLDPNKIFVENIATITTDELMKLFLEAKTEMTPETVTRGQKTGTALVDFQIPPDIGRIQNMCKKYACQKQHWKVSPVEQTRRVKVTTTSRLPDPETIGLYFENKRKSQGGDVESVETSPIDDSCVVTFVDNKDAERVCEADKHHKVNNCELIVSLYYPCLDREPVIAIPPPIVVTHLDKNVVKFLNRSSTYRTKVEESLAKEYGEPVWTPADENGDIGFHIKCMVTETDAKASQKIKRWSDNCVGTLDWVSHSVDSTDDILVAVEIWDAVKKDLATLEVRKPDCVLVFMENHLRSILVVGEAKLVGDVSRQICGVIEKIEETFDQENDVITKQLQLKHFEITLARASRLESKMQKENVQCEIKGDTRQIVLKGKKKNVDKALQRINDIRKSFVKKEVQGGQDIQRELDAIRKKTTNSPAFGNVYRTTGGRLPAKSIIHAVSPICNAGSDDEYSQLHRCLYNSLLKADQLGMRSIAFPPFGKGAYKFSSEKVAEYFVKAVKQYLTAANISPRLHTIIMYDKDGQTLDHVKRQLQAEGLMKGSNKVPDNQEEASGGVDMRRPTSRTIAIDVVDGSLVAQQADVIVNSTNTYLDLSVGVVSKQLLQAAGDSLQSECKSLYPQGIDYGQVASTKAGNMGNCKALFHGALPRWDKGQGQAQYALSTFVKKCLQKADSRGYRSIAFPALGTGACGYPRDLVASTMFEIVEAYSEKTPNSTLRNVSVVIWSEDHTTIRAFKDVQNNRKSARKSDGVRVSTYMMDSQNDIYASGSSYTLAIGPVSLSIVKADLTKQTTDVIVNSVLESLDLSHGILSKAILTAAGQSIQLECNTDAKKQALRTDGFVVTKQGRLMCKNILHMKARGSKAGWTESIVKALEQVEQLGHSSISFPALGTGGRGASPEDMAKAMYSAFKQYSCSGKYRGSLKFIRIVIYQAEMVERFVTVITELSKARKSGGTFLDIFNKKKKDEDVGVGVTISIYTDSKHQADIVTRHIHDLHNVQDLIFPPTLMAKLKDYQVAKIQNCARDCRVKALKTSDGFKLLGFGNSVDTAKRKIKDYMYSIEKELKLAQAKSGIKLPPEWSRMSMADKTMVVTLKPTDLDYVKVAQHFTSQAGMVPPQIVKIERIQNPALYAQYYGKKKQMLDAGGTNVERWLWHGTKGGQAVADNISNNGFNRNYNSGASHGVGVYFAVQAAMSVSGYCLADAMGHKHIFYASVLTGDFCVGSGGIKVPPRKGVGITGMETYDSTTDNIAAPNFFVIFHDSQAYPSYLITFR